MADASAVAGAATSIASALVKEAKYLYGVEDQIRAIQRELECMHEFLQIVEANPYLLKQDGQLRILANNMRELAFRAEDAIDTYLVNVRSKTFNKKFFLKAARLASNAYPVHMLIKEVEAIRKETETAMTRSERYKMSISSTSHSQGSSAGPRCSKPTSEYYLHHNNRFVVGIRDDINLLVKRLTDPEDDFKVLGVVGTGGAGKTTLASQIYSNSKVKSSFSCRVFVSISQQWDRGDLIRRIYKEVMGQSETFSTERELVRELHVFLKDKQCLVIFDDIWDKGAWDEIGPIFPHTKGFRFILTTRKEEVPLYADNKCILHRPKVLTNAQMWKLFSKVAVEGRHGIENNVEFTNLGKLMLKKCHGLPLAVVTLAGILRTKQYLYEWERISVACTNNILKEKGGSTYGVVEDMLELSFLDLTTQLKPLFLYMAIIPEDQEFSAEMLTRMWIAEGFVTHDQRMGCETLEEEAMWLLGELAQRFIVQVEKRDARNQIEYVRLHDLMKEFCIRKAIECQFLHNVTSTCLYERSTRKSRRSSIFSSEYCLEENQYLRTMIYDCASSWNHPEGTIHKLESIHNHFRLLRVLSISNSKNDKLPKEIGNLIHLTFLSIVRTGVKKLPESVQNLCNLIYFVYIVKYDVEAELPNDLVAKMENLRVLELPHKLKCGSSKCNSRLGLSSDRHKKLHTFKCGPGKWMAEDLPTLNLPILRNLCFTFLTEKEEMEAVHQCLGFFKATLHTLDCSFLYGELYFDVEKLREFQSLWSLDLRSLLVVNGCSIQFPPNLLSLTLMYSRIGEGVDLSEALGRLSKLKHLHLGPDSFQGTQLSFGGTTFPQLRELIFYSIPNLEEWRLEGRAMDGLERIEIEDCLQLKRLPERIRSIATLKELKIKGMPKEFCKKLGYKNNAYGKSTRTDGIGRDSYIIQHIPSIIIENIQYSARDWNTEIMEMGNQQVLLFNTAFNT